MNVNSVETARRQEIPTDLKKEIICPTVPKPESKENTLGKIGKANAMFATKNKPNAEKASDKLTREGKLKKAQEKLVAITGGEILIAAGAAALIEGAREITPVVGKFIGENEQGAKKENETAPPFEGDKI